MEALDQFNPLVFTATRYTGHRRHVSSMNYSLVQHTRLLTTCFLNNQAGKGILEPLWDHKCSTRNHEKKITLAPGGEHRDKSGMVSVVDVALHSSLVQCRLHTACTHADSCTLTACTFQRLHDKLSWPQAKARSVMTGSTDFAVNVPAPTMASKMPPAYWHSSQNTIQLSVYSVHCSIL